MQQNDLLSCLNEQQRAAVTHIDGPLLTLAGPGSGKTRVVTHRIANLIQHGINEYNILALTFTNKAAEEMRSRVGKLVGNSSVWMGTFHGYCARFLRVHARAVGLPENYSIYDPSDAKSALKSAVEKTNVELTHLSIDQVLRDISDLKNKLVTPETVEANVTTSTAKILSRLYPAYQAELLKNGAVDFDDLLLHTATLLRNYPDLRSELDAKHKYILVDEYQDTNFAQYIIIRSLSIDHPNLNVTGDPDQSVYGWRGANIQNILSFERDYENQDVAVIRLEENYRSTPEILSIADSLIAHNTQRKEKHLLPTRKSGEKVKLVVYPNDREEANHIIEQIQHAITNDGKRASDFAILYRTNAHSRLLEQSLITRGMNYQLIGGFRFYQRQEIKDILAYLNLLNNPTDDVAFLRVINTPTRGFGKKTLATLQELATKRGISLKAALEISIAMGTLSAKANKNAKDFLLLYDELGSLTIGPVVDLLNHLIERTNYIEHLKKKRPDDPDASVEENLKELLADAAQTDAMHPDGDGLEYFLEQVALLSDTDNLETSSDRVTLMTLHSAKGLEFPSVYLIGVEQDVLPHVRSKDDPKQLEEERRLLFVGMTRAMNSLQLSVAQRRGFGKSRLSAPSPFLLEIPRHELKMIDYTDRFSFNADASQWYDENDQTYQYESNRQRRNRDIGVGDDYEIDGSSNTEPDYDDDHSQLPQDELAARIESMLQKKRDGKSKVKELGSALVTASQIGSSSDKGFAEGVRVQSEKYGLGTIQSLDGRGLKRICRVRFDDQSEIKSFYLHQSKLTLVSPE